MMSKDWLQYHFETERHYASQLLSLPKDSPARRDLFQEAYSKIKSITDCYSPDLSETDHSSFMPHIIKLLLPAKGKVLDIGCASGNLIEELLKMNYYVKGIDVCLEYIVRSQEKLKKIGEYSTVEHADIQSYITNEKYDCIVMDNVLEHIYPDCALDVMNKCYKMLNREGYIVIISPHRFSGPHDISFHFVPLGSKAQGLHFREYSFTDLYDLLITAGFQQVLGFPLYPGYYPRLGIRPSRWAAKKAIFFERMAMVRLFTRTLSLNRRLTLRIVATLFPCMCVGLKNEKM